MSKIFDALQRAEAERSGTNAQSPLVATEVLARAERLATSEWEKEGSNVSLRDTSASSSRLHAALPQELVAAIPGLISSSDSHTSHEIRSERGLVTVQDLDLNLPEESRLVCVSQPDSPSAEAVRLLGVRLRDLRQDRVLKKILITSTVPQEGKSTVAANLAYSLALTGKERVLLLEGDVRRPTLTRLFGLESLKGMCEWLQGEEELAHCMYRIKPAGLWILPAGAAGRNPIDLLQTNRIGALMSALEQHFDTIIVDSPPILPLADTSVWTRLADGILLVTREGVTQKKQLQKGVAAIDREKLIGALLNGSTQSEHAYYYY